MDRKRILIAGGGTGGHLFPALAIGEEIQRRKPNTEIHYVGSSFGLESRVFPIKDVWHTLLPIRGLQRGIGITSIKRNFLLPFRIVHSLIKIRKLINDFIPHMVIGTGGYAAALPIYIASNRNKSMPIILQEQNSFPGITTRLFAKKARKVCIAFSESEKRLKCNTVLTGNPVRNGISNGNKKVGLKNFGFEDNKKTIFLFGGSQGSAYLNSIFSKVSENLSRAGVQVLWQTGELEYKNYKPMQNDRLRVLPFVNEMADAYAMADLLICRSGALTLSEITVCGKPALLIPLPYAAGDHQTKNAQSLSRAGAAKLLSEKSLTPKELMHSIMTLVHNEKELKKMSLVSLKLARADATTNIVNHIFEELR